MNINSHKESQLASWLGFGLLFIALGSLNFTHVLDRYGLPIALVTALYSVFSAKTAFFFIAASQICPDPVGAPLDLTLTQLFVCVWLLTLPVNGTLRHLPAITSYARYLLPFASWLVLTQIVNGVFYPAWFTAFLIGLVTILYAESENRPEQLLWMLAAGNLFAVFGYWGNQIGVPVAGINYDDAVRGGLRFGSGRGDVNWAALCIAFYLLTTVSLLMADAKHNLRRRSIVIIGILATLALGVPALFYTGSRAGTAYFVIGIVWIVVLMVTLQGLRSRFFYIGVYGVLIIVTLLVAFPSDWTESDLTARLSAQIEISRSQASEYGTSTAIAPRAMVWLPWFEMAMKYPWLGMPSGTFMDLGPQYGAGFYGDPDWMMGGAHNVFLGTAATSGVLGLVFLIWMFFGPLWRILACRGLEFSIPILTGYLVVFLGMLNLGIESWKTYWALFSIALVCANRDSRFLAKRATARV